MNAVSRHYVLAAGGTGGHLFALVGEADQGPRLAATVLTLGGKPARSRLREPESRLAQRAAHLPEPEAA